MKGIVLSGTSSGLEKTVATLAALRGLIDHGESPQPAKIGPDFIDPSHHRLVTGVPSRTLDLWLEGKRGVARNYFRSEGSICVAEGVMGTYDCGDTSTAAVAAELDLPDVDGVYLPGGYPELYPEELESSPTLQQLAEKARGGLPVFGECGGMIAMSKGLTTGEGERYEMAGILPAEARMVDELQGLGYVELEGRDSNPFSETASTIRGHEFHYSRMEVGPGAEYGFDVLKGQGIDGEHDGLVKGNSIGTYGHFHPESGLFDDFLKSLQG